MHPVDSVSQTKRQHKFSVRLHGEYKTGLALLKHHLNLILQSFRSVSLDLHQCITSTDEDSSLRIESFAIINYIACAQHQVS